MSRNLGQSSCCNTVARLSDMRGKPVEFRRYNNGMVHIGVKWACPECGTLYFLSWHDRTYQAERGRYVSRFALDLSYYESFNDEPGEPGEVRHLCLDDATDIQEVW